MKDLAFLMLTLGMVTFITMAAQQTWRSDESEKNRQFREKNPTGYVVEATPTPSPSPPIR